MNSVRAKVAGGRITVEEPVPWEDGDIDLVLAPALNKTKVAADLLLFVATKSEEDALKKVAVVTGRPDIAGEWATYVDLGVVGSRRVVAAKTAMGAIGDKGSASKAALCVIETGASEVISTGTAFGVDTQTQKPGDILVSTHVAPYEYQLVTEESDGRIPKFSLREMLFYRSNPSLLSLARLQAEKLQGTIGVHFGIVMSGSARIQSETYRDHLDAKVNARAASVALGERVVGGEMEGVGLLSSPLDAEKLPRWLIVKAISDFAGRGQGEQARGHRAQVSEEALRFTLAALRQDQQPMSELVSPTPESTLRVENEI